MHHLAKLTRGTHDFKPYNIQCSCGTGGDFGGKEEALNWMLSMHFRTLGGTNTSEFLDLTPHETVSELPAPEPASETVTVPPPGPATEPATVPDTAPPPAPVTEPTPETTGA